MKQNEPPEWVKQYAQDCRVLLGIGDEWHISIFMNDRPDGMDTVGGSVQVDTQYFNAVIELRRDNFAEEDDEAHQIILHEMLHIALASYRLVVEQLFMGLPETMRAMAETMVSQAEEQFIQRTSRALLRSISVKSDRNLIDQDFTSEKSVL